MPTRYSCGHTNRQPVKFRLMGGNCGACETVMRGLKAPCSRGFYIPEPPALIPVWGQVEKDGLVAGQVIETIYPFRSRDISADLTVTITVKSVEEEKKEAEISQEFVYAPGKKEAVLGRGRKGTAYRIKTVAVNVSIGLLTANGEIKYFYPNLCTVPESVHTKWN